jgi:hypothetical protein
MPMNDDKLIKELRQLDPVEPGSLDGAAESDAAGALLGRILAADPEAAVEPSPVGEGRGSRRGWWRPTPARLAPAGTAVAAVVVAVLLLGSATGGSGGGNPDRLVGALDQAAAVAGAQPAVGVARPYSYLKARELAVDITNADQRTWHVSQVTTREEWMTPDGPGRMRIIAGPSHFVGSSDRA